MTHGASKALDKALTMKGFTGFYHSNEKCGYYLELSKVCLSERNYSQAERIAQMGIAVKHMDYVKSELYLVLGIAYYFQEKHLEAEEAARQGLRAIFLSEPVEEKLKILLGKVCKCERTHTVAINGKGKREMIERKNEDSAGIMGKAQQEEDSDVLMFDLNKTPEVNYVTNTLLLVNKKEYAKAEETAREGVTLLSLSNDEKSQLYLFLSMVCIKQKKYAEGEEAARMGLNVPDICDKRRKDLQICMSHSIKGLKS